MAPAPARSPLYRRRRERLSAADASNVLLDADDQVNVFLMAGLLATDDPDAVVDLDRLRAELAARLTGPAAEGLARFSQRVTPEPPLHWEDCAPDLSWHVRRVEPVAGLSGLSGLCATLMTRPLPLDRPLWELLVVPGAAPGRTGVVLRVHHAVSDGVGAVRLMQRLFGSEPADRPPAPPPPGDAPRRPRLAGARRVLAMFRTAIGPTRLLGEIGPKRGVGFADVELEPLASQARQHGATVNDALLAAVAGAAATVLRAAGESLPETLPVSVPVALPDRGTSGNAVGVMRIPLPVREPDPAVRLARIAAATRQAKTEARAQGTFELTRTRWGTRMFAWLARRQRFVALFVTNVRGPAQQLTVGGVPLVRAWPLAPIQGNVRLGVAAMSYAGRLGVAVHVDAAALPADLLAAALTEQLERLAAG